ncbi:hypothetical protein [Terrilactibacillus laevilacticus]|uniref:Uncharacterized protein n=1 Tax=Terrilactibacillus laevilacticus TaxID=1380157 RepID=A0ABW5PLM2_9BACI
MAILNMELGVNLLKKLGYNLTLLRLDLAFSYMVFPICKSKLDTGWLFYIRVYQKITIFR